MKRFLPPIEKFNLCIEKRDGCWSWHGSKTDKGYGTIWDGIRLIKLHRFSWELHNGPIPDGLCVCHHCDNRECANPDHLFVGTHSDNMKDGKDKGRFPKGQLNGKSVLTNTQVSNIREQFALGCNGPEIARLHNIATTTAYQIKKGNTWQHLLSTTTCVGQ